MCISEQRQAEAANCKPRACDRRTENGRQRIVIGKTEKVEITSAFRFFNAEIDWVPAIGKKKAGGIG